MCVNTKPEPKCMCADGFLLDYDDETCTGNFSLLFVEIDTCFIVRRNICIILQFPYMYNFSNVFLFHLCVTV